MSVYDERLITLFYLKEEVINFGGSIGVEEIKKSLNSKVKPQQAKKTHKMSANNEVLAEMVLNCFVRDKILNLKKKKTENEEERRE